MAQTLEELRTENAAAEEAETKTPHVEEEVTDEVVVEVEAEELDESGETDEVDAGKAETEDWMKGDTDDDDDASAASDAKFNDSDMAGLRRKMKGKLEQKDEELERLQRENEELRNGGRKQSKIAKPKRDDYEDDDAYQEDLINYSVEVRAANDNAKRQQAERKTQNDSKARETEQAVDKHYERAVTLAKDSDISADMYQNADYKVRTMIEGLFPDAGNAVTDTLIANLGEGSEKVMYSLGVKASRLEKLKELFIQDPTGVKSSMFLGQMKAELNAPRKRKTNAPKPAPDVNGDVSATANAAEKALKKEYQNADTAGDFQARFNARRKARKAGVDTTNW